MPRDRRHSRYTHTRVASAGTLSTRREETDGEPKQTFEMSSRYVPQAAHRRLEQLCCTVTACTGANESHATMVSPREGTRIELIAQSPNATKQTVGAANIRVTLVDEATGDHLSWATVIEQELRFGVSSFRCGGIGGVATPNEHRRKGYSTIVMKAAVQYMRTQGYPMTYLFGISNYYEGPKFPQSGWLPPAFAVCAPRWTLNGGRCVRLFDSCTLQRLDMRLLACRSPVV